MAMTLNELKEKLDIRRGNGYNSYIVKMQYNGRTFQCHSNNSVAWDRLSDAKFRNPRDKEGEGITEKEAYEQFRWECMHKNYIGTETWEVVKERVID